MSALFLGAAALLLLAGKNPAAAPAAAPAQPSSGFGNTPQPVSPANKTSLAGLDLSKILASGPLQYNEQANGPNFGQPCTGCSKAAPQPPQPVMGPFLGSPAQPVLPVAPQPSPATSQPSLAAPQPVAPAYYGGFGGRRLYSIY